MSAPTKVLDAIVREVDADRRAALCVVVARRGSAPQSPGALLCVDEAGRMTGTVGGGCMEAEVRRRALRLLATGGGELLTTDLDDDDGLICGGQLDTAIEVISAGPKAEALRVAAKRLKQGLDATIVPRVRTEAGWVEYQIPIEETPRLIIAGGGHVGLALARLVVPLGFGVTVVDDRGSYVDPERFPPPIETVEGDIAATLRGATIDRRTYVVIVTRGHRHDEAALDAVIASPARYIGMIGSRRKIATIYDELKRRGVTDAQLDRVHAPIGVGIGAVTPEEIGVSIAAELIAVRRGQDGSGDAGG